MGHKVASNVSYSVMTKSLHVEPNFFFMMMLSQNVMPCVFDQFTMTNDYIQPYVFFYLKKTTGHH